MPRETTDSKRTWAFAKPLVDTPGPSDPSRSSQDALQTRDASASTVNNKQHHTATDSVLALEPRVMFDAAALLTGAEVSQEADPTHPTDAELSDTEHEQAEAAAVQDDSLREVVDSFGLPAERRELVFIDTSVDEYQTLIAGITPNADVILLDSTRDGIKQIADILQDDTNIDAIHLITHGEQGTLQLGTGRLTWESMKEHYADELAQIKHALSDKADLLIYGCNFGEGQAGQAAAARLAQLTGADIAASNDLTGNADLDGDWDLEVTTGSIETEIAFNTLAQEEFVNVLDITTGLVANWTFDSDATDSSGNSNDGILSGDAAIDTTNATNIVGEGKLSLDGTGDYVNLNAHISNFSGLTEGTISAWVKLTDTGESTIFGLSDKDEFNELIKFSIDEGQLKWLNLNDAVDNVIVYSTATINDGAWHHVAVTVNSSGNTLYIDGAATNVTYSNGSAATTAFFDDIIDSDTLEIGRSVRGNTAEFEYDGFIDETRVYNRALSADDIAKLATDNDAPTFDVGDGSAVTDISGDSEVARDMVVQPDGKILVAGYSDNGTDLDFSVIRYNSDGSLDTSFGTNGKVLTAIGSGDDTAISVALQADGKILLAGSSFNGSNFDFAVVRYNSNGSLDTSFSGDGTLTTAIGGSQDFANSITVQTDGKIVVAGSSHNGAENDVAVVRYNSNGTLDTTFHSDGIVTTAAGVDGSSAISVVVQPDGKIVAAGNADDGSHNFALVRYNSNGSLDNGFGTNGVALTDFVGNTETLFDLVLQPDGKLLVAGKAFTGSTDDFAIARYNTNGTLDTSFSVDGKVTTGIGSGKDVARAITLQTDGKILVGGYSHNGSDNDYALVRYTSNGSLDTSFGSNGKVTTAIGNESDVVTGVAMLPDGKILLSGYTDTGSANNFAVVKYNADGSRDSRFGLENSLDGHPTFMEDGVAVTLDGDVEIFDEELSASDDFGGATVTLERNGAANADDVYSAIGNLSFVGDRTGTINLTPAGVIGTYSNTSGTLTLTFAANTTNAQVNEVMQSIQYRNTSNSPPATVQINWTFNDGNTGSQGTGGALTATGSTTVTITAVNDAPTFERGDGIVVTDIPGSSDSQESLTIQADGKILVAGNSVNGGTRNFALTRYNTDGTLDTTFGAGDGIVTTAIGTGEISDFSIALQSDGKILVSGYANVGSTNDFAVARYLADGTLDTSFGGNGIVTTAIGTADDKSWSVAVQPDGKIVVAGESSNGTNNDFALVRYTTDGTLDTTFGAGDGIVTTPIGAGQDSGYSMALQSDGKILVSGVAVIGSTYDVAVVRYLADGTLDSSFGGDGIVTTAIGTGNDFSWSVTVQPDNKILVSGVAVIGSTFDFAIVRYLADGTLDTSFGGDGIVTTAIGTGQDFGQDVTVQLDGKILVAGFSSNGTDHDFAMTRYNIDGTLDTSFGGGDGIVTTAIGTGDDYGRSIRIQSDGKILIAGTTIDGSNRFALVRYHPDGTLDTSFDHNILNSRPTFTEGGSAVILDVEFTLSDRELDALNGGTGNYSGASLTLARNGGANADDVLSFTDANGLSLSGSTLLKNSQIIASFDTTTSPGQLVITWTDANGEIPTSADVDHILRQLTYANSSETPPASAQIDWTFTDGNTGSQGTGGALTDAGSTTVTITAVNDVPVITNLGGDTLVYTEGDGAQVIDQSSNATIIDVDSSHFETGTLTVRFTAGSDSAEDVLSIRDQGPGASNITVAGTTVSYGGTPIGTVAGGSGGTNLVITFNANANATAVGAVLQNITYENTDTDDPTTGNRTVRYVLTDGDGGTSANYDTTVTVTTTNNVPTFEIGTGTIVSDTVASQVFTGGSYLMADGRLLVVGTFDDGSNSNLRLMRYNEDGSLDSSFGSGGVVTTVFSQDSLGKAVTVQADGKIVVAGQSSSGSTSDMAVARYHANGTLDTTFNTIGKLEFSLTAGHDDARAIAIQPDGKIVLTGKADSSDFDVAVVRLNQDGSFDTTFDGDGKLIMQIGTANDYTEDVVIQSDGKIVVSGYYQTPDNHDEAFLLRFNHDGNLDSSFDSDGIITTSYGINTIITHGKLTIDGSGRIITATGILDGVGSTSVATRYNIDGSLDTTFGSNGIAEFDLVSGFEGFSTVKSLDNGKLILTGLAMQPTTGTDLLAVRLNDDGSLDTTFNGNGVATVDFNFDTDAISAHVAADGDIVIVGQMYEPSNAQINIARLTSDGSTDLTFNPVDTLDGTPTFIEGGAAVRLDADVEIFDEELSASDDFGGATVTLERNGAANADDVYSAIGNLSFVGDRTGTINLTPAGVIGTYSNTSGTLTLTFAANTTNAQVNEVMQSIQYRNTSNSPPATVQINWTFNDGNTGSQGTGGALTATGSTTVTITAVNDAPTFERGDGIVVTDIPGSSDSQESLTIQADGKILVAGNSVNGGTRNFALTRYNTDGTLDTTFGAGDGIVTTAIGTGEISDFSIALQSDGKILVSGYANVGSTNDFAVARYLADGTLDTSFGGNGIVTTAIGTADDKSWSVAVQPDGKIVVAGESSNGTNNDFALVRYTTDGTLDTTFGAGDGIVTTPIGAGQDSGYSMALQSDGKILVSGVAVIGSTYDVAVVRYLADGTLDSSFGGDGIVTTAIGTGNDFSWSVTVQPDNKILVSGVAVIGSTFDFAIVRYLADGTLDTSFGGDGIVTTAIGTGQDFGQDVTVQLDGKILVAGFSSNGTDHDFAMTRYNIDGTLDTSFGGGDGIVTTAIGTGDDYGRSIRIQSDGKILIAGTTIDGSNRFALVRYHPDGTLDTSFDHNILNSRPTFTEGGSAVILDVEFTLSDRELDALNGGTGNYSGASLTLARNGGANADDVLSFTDANGLSLSGSTLLKNSQIIASFDTTTSPGQLVITWTDANGEIPTSADVDHILRQLTYANSSETPPASAQIDWTFTDGNTGSQGTGGALTDAGSTTVTITAVNDAPTFEIGTGKIVSEAGAGQQYTNRSYLMDDGRLLVTSTIDNGSNSNLRLMRYNEDGRLDSSFGSGGIVTTVFTQDSFGRAVKVQADGKIVVVGGTTDGSSGSMAVARYHADGTLDTTFNTNGKLEFSLTSGQDDARAIAFQQDGKIVLTGYADSSNPDVAVVRLNSDGSFDTTFDGDGKLIMQIGTADHYTEDVVIQSDGKIVVGGDYQTADHSEEAFLIRFNNDGSLDSSFDSDGIVTTSYGVNTIATQEMLAIDSSGRITAAGAVEGVNSTSVATRYNIDGSLDTTFGNNGIAQFDLGSNPEGFTSVNILDNGKIVLTGQAEQPATGTDLIAVRLNTDGSLDTTFNGNGFATIDFDFDTDGISGHVAADGDIIIVGQMHEPSNAQINIARLNSDGSPDVTFNPVNTLDGHPTFVEDGVAVTLDGDVEIFDEELSDSDDFGGATLTLERNGASNADDVYSATGNLSFVGDTTGTINLTPAGVIGTYSNSDGTLTLTFAASTTNSQVNEVMQSIQYRNTSDSPPATVQIDWTFNDQNTSGAQGGGGALTATGSTTVTITATNDAPDITDLDGDTLAYTKSDGAVVIDQSSNATVIDVDSTNFETGTLTVSFTAGSDSAEDVLAIRHQGADAGQIGVSGPNVTYAGTMIGTVTGGTSGTNLVITFNSNAEATAVSALLNNITYANTDTENPTTSPRTVRYRLTDGDGGTSATHDVLITVANPNSAPTITSNGGGALAHITVAESTTAVTTVTATDPDLPGDTFTYQLVGGADASHFVINSRTGALAFTTTPDFETPHDTNADNQYHIQVQVDDGHGGTDLQTMVVEVTNTMEPLPPMPEPEPEPETETEGEAEGDSTTEDKQPTTMTSPTTTPPPPGPLSPVVLTQGPTPQDSTTDKSATAARVGREFDHQLAALSPRQVRDLTSAHRLGLSDTLSDPIRILDLPYAAPRVSIGLELQLEALASHLHSTIQQDQLDLKIVSGVTAGTGLALSAGYVAWILRGVSFLTSLFASLPAWRHFDPLPILTGGYTAHKTGQETNGAAIDQENKEHQGLDEIFHDSDQD